MKDASTQIESLSSCLSMDCGLSLDDLENFKRTVVSLCGTYPQADPHIKIWSSPSKLHYAAFIRKWTTRKYSSCAGKSENGLILAVKTGHVALISSEMS